MKDNINPNFRKRESKQYSLEEAKEGLKRADHKILAQIISRAESHLIEDQEFVLEVMSELPDGDTSRIIAVSGAPGVGKSTFINTFGKYLLEKGHSLAVLPVDPASHISKGSILGDKTRMADIIGHPECFVKPMSSSLALGGVAPSTHIASMLCQQAGFDYIFIETVGVGQSEYKVRFMVDCFLLLIQPGSGDDLQGIKRGIMEMSDIIVINKVDGSLKNEANASLDACKASLRLMLPNRLGWKTKMASYSSVSGEHTETLAGLIDSYYAFLEQNNLKDQLRTDQSLSIFKDYADEIMIRQLMNRDHLRTGLSHLREQLKNNGRALGKVLMEWRKIVMDEFG